MCLRVSFCSDFVDLESGTSFKLMTLCASGSFRADFAEVVCWGNGEGIACANGREKIRNGTE